MSLSDKRFHGSEADFNLDKAEYHEEDVKEFIKNLIEVIKLYNETKGDNDLLKDLIKVLAGEKLI